MNGQTFSQKPRKRGKSHHHSQFLHSTIFGLNRFWVLPYFFCQLVTMMMQVCPGMIDNFTLPCGSEFLPSDNVLRHKHGVSELVGGLSPVNQKGLYYKG